MSMIVTKLRHLKNLRCSDIATFILEEDKERKETKNKERKKMMSRELAG